MYLCMYVFTILESPDFFFAGCYVHSTKCFYILLYIYMFVCICVFMFNYVYKIMHQVYFCYADIPLHKKILLHFKSCYMYLYILFKKAEKGGQKKSQKEEKKGPDNEARRQTVYLISV